MVAIYKPALMVFKTKQKTYSKNSKKNSSRSNSVISTPTDV